MISLEQPNKAGFFLHFRMRQWVVRILLLLALANPLVSRSEESCKSFLLGETPVSLAALDVLRDARGSFDIEVVSKLIDGKPRAVILAGESHVKRKKASLAGAKLNGQFPFRGLEGADISKNGIAGTLFVPVLASIDFIAKKILRLKGSSIDDAWVHSGREIAKNEMAIEIASRLKAERGVATLRLTAVEEQELLAGLREIELETGENGRRIVLMGEEVLPLIRLHLADPAPAPARMPMLNLPLEEGHQPGVRENLAMTELPLTLALIGSDLTLSYFSGHGYPDLTGTSQMVSLITSLTAVYTLTKFALQKKHSEKRWFRILFPLDRGLLEGRNETMITNIEKGFVDHPDYDQMLVFVGQAHVKGMKRLLMERSGFREVKIPEIP
jgi:hypothetical protein